MEILKRNPRPGKLLLCLNLKCELKSRACSPSGVLMPWTEFQCVGHEPQKTSDPADSFPLRPEKTCDAWHYCNNA